MSTVRSARYEQNLFDEVEGQLSASIWMGHRPLDVGKTRASLS